MNRKLQHTVMALSATATVFTVLLLAAGPIAHPVAPVGPVLVAMEATDATEAAVLADAPSAEPGARRHLRRSRAALALPYFSFAQGLRHGRS